MRKPEFCSGFFDLILDRFTKAGKRITEHKIKPKLLFCKKCVVTFHFYLPAQFITSSISPSKSSQSYSCLSVIALKVSPS